MSGRKAREQRRASGRLNQVVGSTVDVAIFEEIHPDDPRYASFGPNATRDTLDEALRRGELDPNCDLCRKMLAHRGPSILNRVVPETDAEG